MNRLAVPAVGFLFVVLGACAPMVSMPEPPTYEGFSQQGAPQPPPQSSRVASASTFVDSDSGEQGIYVRTAKNGSVVISDGRNDEELRNRRPASNKLYRWRDANGREHITDAPPPADAKQLGEISRTR